MQLPEQHETLSHVAPPSPRPSSGAWLERPSGEREVTRRAAAGGDGRATDLHEIARGALRGALRAHARSHAPDAETRAALRSLCDTAWARGLHAEELLVLLKNEWRGLPAPRLAARDHEGAVLAGVITLCIEEYYAPRRR